jgi:hypothetical protein
LSRHPVRARTSAGADEYRLPAASVSNIVDSPLLAEATLAFIDQ